MPAPDHHSAVRRDTAVRPRTGQRSRLAALSVLAVCLAACSSSDADERGLGAHPAAAGTGGTGTTLIVDPGTSGGSVGDGSGATTGTPASCDDSALDGCVGEYFEGESLPLDLYVMFDQSGSMLNDVGGLTRLAAVQQATTEFLRDPATRGIGVGIGYFGDEPIGETSCEPASYAAPAVPISLDHESVIASLDARTPTGETPTAAALDGACGYAAAWKQDHPERAVVVLLVTDGKPEAPVSCASGSCCPDIDTAEAAARACHEQMPFVSTYVLGVGPELDLLNRIAAAGGTKQAYLVGNDQVAANVLAALSKIRGDAAIPCSLAIPEPPAGERPDFGLVNLLAGTDCLSPIYHVETAADCGTDGGWYYDDPSAPKSVELCASTCGAVSLPGTRLRFSIGCQTAGQPVR